MAFAKQKKRASRKGGGDRHPHIRVSLIRIGRIWGTSPLILRLGLFSTGWAYRRISPIAGHLFVYDTGDQMTVDEILFLMTADARILCEKFIRTGDLMTVDEILFHSKKPRLKWELPKIPARGGVRILISDGCSAHQKCLREASFNGSTRTI